MTTSTSPPVRRRILMLTLAVVLVIVGAAVSWWQLRDTPERLLQQGLSAARTNRDEAERLFHAAIAQSGGTYPDAELALAIVLARKNAWDEALRRFATLEKPALRADLLLDFGERALRDGRRTAGLEALEEVRRRESADSVPALELLVAEFAEGEQHEELIEATRALARLQPDRPARWLELIDLLKSMRRDAECLEAIEEALQQALPDEARHELRHRLVDRLIVGGDGARAKSEISRLEAEEGNTLRLRGDKIDLYRMEGDLDRALELLTEIFPEIKDRPDAHFVRGAIYLDLGRFAEAADDLQQAVQVRPFNDTAHYKLSQAYHALGRADDAQRERRIAERISKKRGRISELLNQLADDPGNRRICREIAALHRELDEIDLALHRELDEIDLANRWERRASR